MGMYMGNRTLKKEDKRQNTFKQRAKQINRFAKIAVLATGLTVAANISNAQSINTSPVNVAQNIEYISKDTTAFGLFFPWVYIKIQETKGRNIKLTFLTSAKIHINKDPTERMVIGNDKFNLVLSIKDQKQLKDSVSLEKDGLYLAYYRSCTNYIDINSYYDRLDIYEIKSK